MYKKLFNQGVVLFIVGIFAGAFYREFTKFVGFSGITSMSLVHTHLIATGAFVAFIFSIILKVYEIEETKNLKIAWNLYLIGAIMNAALMFFRGIFTILELDMGKTLNMSISGIAGVFHILLTIGSIWFLLQIRKSINAK